MGGDGGECWGGLLVGLGGYAQRAVRGALEVVGRSGYEFVVGKVGKVFRLRGRLV